MKIKHIFSLLFILSVIINAVYFFSDQKTPSRDNCNEVYIYPQDESSLDYPISHDPENPKYSGYTLDGDSTEFLSFNIRGTIQESIERKYDFKLPVEIIRNIQEIVYFLNDYKISFREGDKISFFYRGNDKKIVYLRFKSSRKRSISEVFLFKTGRIEKYVTSEGSYLQPCITNGPFESCPQVRFITENDQLIPVFDVYINEPVKLPFLAKFVDSSNTKTSGGNAEFVYSNFGTRAFFQGLGSISNLRKNALYKKDAVIGRGGYIMKDGKSGVVYFLRKKDNTVISPYIFHHIENTNIDEKDMQNLAINVSFFSIHYEKGYNFELKYYAGAKL